MTVREVESMSNENEYEGGKYAKSRVPMKHEIEGTREYLLSLAMGSIHYINGDRYHKVEELWWASSKPSEVDKLAKVWRAKGYLVRSRYVKVEAGTSWNNSPNDMKMYSIYAAYKGDSQ